MNIKNTNEQKYLLWALFLSSLIGISIWLIRRLSLAPFSEWGSSTFEMFTFFTILSNTIVIVMAGALLAGRGKVYDWFKSPGVQSACCLYIAFVGLGFWLLLGGPQNVQSWWLWIPEITAHTLSPILGAVYFVLGVPKGHLNWKHPFLWLSYPIAYLVFWLFWGPRVGYYPYFFIDVDAIGYSGVAIWSGALIVVFLILGTIMLRVDRWQASRDVALSAIG